MLRRKVYRTLEEWKGDRPPLILKGCRQCGKRHSVLEFSRSNYRNVAYINFFENGDFNSVFDGSMDTSRITVLMSAQLKKPVNFEAGNTLIILDGIQECPNARTALKLILSCATKAAAPCWR